MIRNELSLLDDVRGLIIDLDGVLYLEGHAIEGVDRFVAFLERRGIQAIYVTNNSTLPVEKIAERLVNIGVPADLKSVLTSASAAAAYLRRAYPPGSSVFVVGEIGLYQAVEEAGMVPDGERPAAVVTGLDTGLTYEKIKRASNAILKGADFVVCNADHAFPTRTGISPGAGAIAAAIQTTTGREPVVIGKPATGMFLEAAERMGLEPEACAVIGDRLDVDIRPAKEAAMTSILVLSGLTSPEMLADPDPAPDLVFENVGELAEAWEARMAGMGEAQRSGG